VSSVSHLEGEILRNADSQQRGRDWAEWSAAIALHRIIFVLRVAVQQAGDLSFTPKVNLN
jgi:hypothetical protein